MAVSFNKMVQGPHLPDYLASSLKLQPVVKITKQVSLGALHLTWLGTVIYYNVSIYALSCTDFKILFYLWLWWVGMSPCPAILMSQHSAHCWPSPPPPPVPYAKCCHAILKFIPFLQKPCSWTALNFARIRKTRTRKWLILWVSIFI